MYRGDVPGYVVLSDGTVFDGFGFGAQGTVLGEAVFNTSMSGYQEVVTDPSYHGQIVTFTAHRQLRGLRSAARVGGSAFTGHSGARDQEHRVEPKL
jgi:hypothetical protein